MSADPTRIPIHCDPQEQRMVGVATHGNTPFDVPFISNIIGNLWTGGCADGLVLPETIQHVISLYPWEQYEVRHPLRSVTSIVMYDASDQGLERVRDIARWVNACRYDAPTLVHCQAGLNRSGLIAAASLILDGMRPEAAVALLREKRSPAVLCNAAFEAAILKFGREAS